MKYLPTRRACTLSTLALAAAVAWAPPAFADELEPYLGPGFWRLAVAPYSFHFRPSDEHETAYAVAIERQRPDQWMGGFSLFSNSFGQPSAYAYIGYRWPALFGQPRLFAQLTGGLMYGYVDQYEDKVPFNNNGFSPGAVATLGWNLAPKIDFAVHLLGDAAVMFQFSFDLR
jgi:hypothetical protein